LGRQNDWVLKGSTNHHSTGGPWWPPRGYAEDFYPKVLWKYIEEMKSQRNPASSSILVRIAGAFLKMICEFGGYPVTFPREVFDMENQPWKWRFLGIWVVATQIGFDVDPYLGKRFPN